MQVIYCGSHPQVTSPAFTGKADLHGDPVTVTDDIGRELVARGDFIEFTPEPVRPPVEKTKRS